MFEDVVEIEPAVVAELLCGDEFNGGRDRSFLFVSRCSEKEVFEAAIVIHCFNTNYIAVGFYQ